MAFAAEHQAQQLPAIGCSIPLRAIYEGVELAPAPLHNSWAQRQRVSMSKPAR